MVVELHSLLVAHERDHGYDVEADPSWSHSVDAQRYFARRISGEEGVALIVEIETVVIGYLLGGPRPGAVPSGGLESVFVLPGWRIRGAATALAREFIAWCDAAGLRPITVAVAPANAVAVRLYERLGFEPTTLILQRRDH